MTVNSGQTRTLAAGAFGAVSVSGTLNLSGGTYNFRSLQVNNDGRVVALAGAVMRLSNGLTALDRSHVIVATGLRADSLRIEASGSVDGNGTGVSLGNDAEITAVVVAQRAFRAGDRLTATGAIAAQDVTMGFDARLFFDIGFECSSDAQCNDGNACTVDSCVSGRCQNAPTNTCAVAVSVGWNHACAVEADGRVACWGQNSQGQLGDGTGVNRLVPTFVPGVIDAVAVKGVDQDQTCVLRANGGVLCWGANAFGELGDGTTVNRLSPVAAVLPRPAISIDIGGDDFDQTAHACAVLDDHTVWCWGANRFGALGDGTVTPRVTPAPVPGLTNAVSVGAGGGDMSCALLSSGTASCWGRNVNGELGNGDTSMTQSNVPVPVVGVANGAVLSLGFNGVILTRTGSVLSWGFNAVGEVGDGTNINRFSAVPVSNLSDIVAIGAGDFHSCAVHATGAASCWGENFGGALGDGTTVDSNIPVNVVGLSGVKAIAASRFNSCAVKSDGSVWCWGKNGTGAVGDGTTTDRSTPVRTLL
ncbi:MAG TPA: hypothetical protein VJN68_14050 [Burkholderiaceae bacterium]|nr:hypothetical protein [Burkholderiaceae bacterium]